MLNLAIPLLAAAVVLGVIRSLLHGAWRESASRKALEGRPALGPERMRELVFRYGMSSNSFMTLYPGFTGFAPRDEASEGLIAFADTPEAWVGGAEPFTAAENLAQLLREFAEAANGAGKTAILLPVAEPVAREALKCGYDSILIGSEPTFVFDRYPRTGRTWADVVPTAKQLAGKGALVRELAPDTMSPELRSELDAMTREWLGTRKMAALAFLNQVDPWYLSEHKRYFLVEHAGRVLAFLAAIPVPARQAWYLIDLIRRPDSPAGSTELLLLQAMRLLRESGAREATMGVAPLSGLERAPALELAHAAAHLWLYPALRSLYEKGNWFYNFKPLHQYKLKFEPTHSEPIYMIWRNPGNRLGLGEVRSLSRAFMPGGMARATWSGAARLAARLSLAEWIRGQLRRGMVVRSAPPTWQRLLLRCKLTVALFAINVAVYVGTADSAGHLPSALERDWGFSWDAFLASPARSLALSPWLHWGPGHLFLNLISLAAFTGGLEYLAGSGIALACYLVPMLVANPLAGFLVARALHRGFEIDVGASLGIFGCAGALAGFLRRGQWLLGALAAGSVADIWILHSLMPLNHLFALVLGALVGRAINR